jgi:deazaflavin-dependent oxidoreductase (nitroreductase family)
MADLNNWNHQIIEEFRTNAGQIGEQLASAPVIGSQLTGVPLLLLTTTGAKGGQRHITPLVYLPDDDRLIVFASKGGTPTNPDWYHNLLAHPQVTVEVGTEIFEATAIVITGGERDRLYAEQAERFPHLHFAEKQAKTSRKIPVIALERRTS